MTTASVSAFVHWLAPHTKLEFFSCYALCGAGAVVAVYLRCCYTGAHQYLQGSWLVKTAAAAAPIPVYILLPLSPFDPDLARVLLEEQVILALAGLYGLTETIKDIRGTAGQARRAAIAAIGPTPPAPRRWWVATAITLIAILALCFGVYSCVSSA